MGYEFSSASQSIRFPFGAELTQVRVSSTTSAAQNPVIECPLMTIRAVAALAPRASAGVRVKANLYDGIARATIRPSGGGTAISYSLDAVNIARQRLFALPADAAASGTMSGHGKLWFSPIDLTTDRGNGEMSGAGLAISSDFLNAPIRVGNAQGEVQSRSRLSDYRRTEDQRRRCDPDVQRNNSASTRSGRKHSRDSVHYGADAGCRVASESAVRDTAASSRS